MYDLSIIIPARNEEFLNRTIEGVLENKRGNTEIIVVLDGLWAVEPIPQHKDVTVIYLPKNIGQRAAMNMMVRISRAKYIMKLDAHCMVSEGFDQIMMDDMQDDWTMVPTMYNLHALDWVCKKCGNTFLWNSLSATNTNSNHPNFDTFIHTKRLWRTGYFYGHHIPNCCSFHITIRNRYTNTI